MVKWRGRRQSSNVQVRTGGGGGLRLGGGRSPFGNIGIGSGSSGLGFPTGGGGGRGMGSIGGIILVVVVLAAVYFFSGSSGGGLLGGSTTSGSQTTTTQLTNEDMQFLATVLADSEDTWTAIFQQSGQDYPEPTMVFYEGGTETGCGFGTASVGPFYCPLDQMLYLDIAFLDELANDLGAPGDFAQAYIVLHEVGHHVQNVTGILSREEQLGRGASEAEVNALSVRTELQADCYAGIVGAAMADAGNLDPGDLNEAITAAGQIGDDSLGNVRPDSFTHGSAAQRIEWFRTGFTTRSVARCDTFAGL